MANQRPRIAIVGGNFAGLSAAIKLPRQVDVTLLDAHRHFEWIPNIHELLSSVKTPQALRLDRADVLKRAGHRFVQDSVVDLQAAAGRLVTAGGLELAFDACIVAVGGLSNTHGVPGVAKHALPMRSIADALQIERSLAELLAQDQPLNIVIAGGGISGIEALGEILRRHRHRRGLSIDLVEAAPRVLFGQPSTLDADLRKLCRPWPVRFHTDAMIASVTPKGVRLVSGERLRSDLTIWAAGLAPPALLADSGLAETPTAWAPVAQTLQSAHFKQVFVAGDAAAMPKPLGKQAYNAIDMGEMAAANVQRFLTGQPLRDFKPAPQPLLVAFGDLQTYLVAGRTVLASQALAGAKEGVFQLFMSKLTPGNLLTSLPETGGRLWQSWRDLALPQLASLTDFKALHGFGAIRRL